MPRNRKLPKIAEKVRAQSDYVHNKLGDSVICSRCSATCGTYADKCSASLSETCEGFNIIEEARSEFQRDKFRAAQSMRSDMPYQQVREDGVMVKRGEE